MYEYRLAYRHHDGEVEGFKGWGFTARAAEEHALRQIQEKVKLIDSIQFAREPQHGWNRIVFDEKRVIRSLYPHDRKLTRKELEQVKRDWSCR